MIRVPSTSSVTNTAPLKSKNCWTSLSVSSSTRRQQQDGIRPKFSTPWKNWFAIIALLMTSTPSRPMIRRETGRPTPITSLKASLMAETHGHDIRRVCCLICVDDQSAERGGYRQGNDGRRTSSHIAGLPGMPSPSDITADGDGVVPGKYRHVETEDGFDWSVTWTKLVA